MSLHRLAWACTELRDPAAEPRPLWLAYTALQSSSPSATLRTQAHTYNFAHTRTHVHTACATCSPLPLLADAAHLAERVLAAHAKAEADHQAMVLRDSQSQDRETVLQEALAQPPVAAPYSLLQVGAQC